LRRAKKIRRSRERLRERAVRRATAAPRAARRVRHAASTGPVVMVLVGDERKPGERVH
jgi:hypothetical protein